MNVNYLSLALRNALFVILHPGIVIGLGPYLILINNTQTFLLSPLLIQHYFGAITFAIGVIILMHCIYKFVTDGLGTLSPADPTKRLVISGLYKYSRNPMYAGVLAALIGLTIFFWSFYMLLYTFSIFILFNLFIVYKEEPRLTKDYGESYTQYCQKVRRWL